MQHLKFRREKWMTIIIQSLSLWFSWFSKIIEFTEEICSMIVREQMLVVIVDIYWLHDSGWLNATSECFTLNRMCFLSKPPHLAGTMGWNPSLLRQVTKDCLNKGLWRIWRKIWRIWRQTMEEHLNSFYDTFLYNEWKHK